MKKIRETIDYIHNLAVMIFLAIGILVSCLLAAAFNRRTWFWIVIVFLFAGFMAGWLWVCSRMRFG